jgi:hypothetical protein
MRQATASAIVGPALAVILLSGAAGAAQTATPGDTVSSNTLPYRNVYDTSQSLFDKCGDVVRGDLYRKVVREKVAACPFGAAEKADFQTLAAARSTEFARQSAKASAQGPVPGTPDEVRRCKTFTFTAEYFEIRRLLDRYGHGAARADDVIKEACRPFQP